MYIFLWLKPTHFYLHKMLSSGLCIVELPPPVPSKIDINFDFTVILNFYLLLATVRHFS
jgi:hypothetical protein